MKKNICPLALLILALIAVWGLSPRMASSTQAPAKESVFDRVLRTGVLRCAYAVYPPETIKDPNTGKLSGTIVETTEEVGRQLGLKIEWTAEVGFLDVFTGLKTGRYDAFCSGAYENPQRAKEALFTIPFNYGATRIFVRADDTRFDESPDAINDPKITIAHIDGEITQFIIDESFPKARHYSLPALTDISQTLESVATRKADVTFLQAGPARGFMEHNPGKLRILQKFPARVFAAPLIAVPLGEHDLKYLLDATIRTLQENGFVESVLQKYDPTLDSYLLVAKPYRKPF